MKNRAFLDFGLCGRRHSIQTNEVELHKLELEFEKHGPECAHVVEGDIVEYRIIVRNKSNVELHHVEFRDPLHEGFEYVQHSFRVNGRHERPHVHRNELRYRFECIPANCELVITFSVRIGSGEQPEHPCHGHGCHGDKN